jgi:predicted nicotinamide N-methyase
MSISSPFFPETPQEALGEIARETVMVEGREFRIERPKRSDHLLDDPAMRDAFRADEYMPYWADLWPASRMLARAILRSTWNSAATTLEIGCGLGLPGIAALSQGLTVVFSDCDRTALRFAERNARLNGFDRFELLPLDWRFPPEDRRFDLLLASDLCYERRHVDPVVAFIGKVMSPNGMCLLTDQDRPPSAYLREALVAGGLHFDTELMRAGEPGGNRYKGTLYRIRRRAAQTLVHTGQANSP